MPALSFGRSHARVEFHGLSQELLCNGLNNKKSQRKSAVVYEGLICSAQIPKTSKDIYSYSQGTTRGFPTRGALGMRARAKKTGDGTDIGSIDEFDSSYRIVGRICRPYLWHKYQALAPAVASRNKVHVDQLVVK